MLVEILRPYEDALRLGGELHVHVATGHGRPLEIARWLAAADAADHTVLERCRAPVLDIGCGPGRIVAALHEQGMSALGIDIAHTAVALTRRRGAPVLRRSIFSPVPREGTWRTALLLDGNIGIGGDVTRLLGRVRQLLGEGDQLIVETDADPAADVREQLRFGTAGGPAGAEFWWARVGAAALARHCDASGFTSPVRVWHAGGRTFATVRR